MGKHNTQTGGLDWRDRRRSVLKEMGNLTLSGQLGPTS